MIGAPAEFNELMALSGRQREDRVNANAGHWEPILRSGIATARQSGQLDVVAEALIAQGGVLSDFRWIVAGGAQPFTFGGGNNTLNIGSRNIQAVQALLSQHNLPVVGQSVGSNKARTLYTQPAGVTVQLLGGEATTLL